MTNEGGDVEASRQLVKARTSPDVFLVEDGKRRLVPDEATLDSVVEDGASSVQTFDEEGLALLSEGEPLSSVLEPTPREDGTLLYSPDGAAYLLEGGERRMIPDAATFHSTGPRGRRAEAVSEAELRAIPLGSTLALVPSISVRANTFLGAGHYMDTSATLTSDSWIRASTRTRTITALGGFTGGVIVSLQDENDVVIGMTELRSYGVDGHWIGRSDRTDRWEQHNDPGIVARTRSLGVVHAWTPKVDLWGIVVMAIELSWTVWKMFGEAQKRRDAGGERGPEAPGPVIRV